MSRQSAAAGGPHPCYLLAGADLDELIRQMEAGTFRLPAVAVWRNDVPPGTAARLARASGITHVHAAAAGARPCPAGGGCEAFICMTVEEYAAGAAV